MTRRSILKALLLGAATFVAAHAIEVAARIGGDHPWFIAAAPSALVTLTALFAAGVLLAVAGGEPLSELAISSAGLAAGAAVPMVVTLFLHPQGPGNLFPIALAVGTGALLLASFAGAATGWLLRRLARP